MKQFIMALALALFAITPAAVNAADPAMPEGVFIKRQNTTQYLARDLLLGASVQDGNGKIFGDIEDLILNEFNQVEGVIIGVGGVLGLGEKRIGVRYSALEFEDDGGKQVITLPQANKALLKSLPKFERARPPKSFFERVTRKAKELAAKTSDTTSDAYKKAKEKVGPAYEAAKEKAGEAYQAAKEKVQETIDKAKDSTKTQ